MRAAPRRPAGTARPPRRGRSAAPARRRRRGSSASGSSCAGGQTGCRRSPRTARRAARASAPCAGTSATCGWSGTAASGSWRCGDRRGVVLASRGSPAAAASASCAVARGLLPQLVQVAPGSARLPSWSPARERLACLDALRRIARAPRPRARAPAARCCGSGAPRSASASNVCSSDLRRRGNQRKAAGAMDAAQRVARRAPSPRTAPCADRTAAPTVRARAWRHAASPRRPGSSTATSTRVTPPIVISSGSAAMRRAPRPAAASGDGHVGDQLQHRRRAARSASGRSSCGRPRHRRSSRSPRCLGDRPSAATNVRVGVVARTEFGQLDQVGAAAAGRAARRDPAWAVRSTLDRPTRGAELGGVGGGVGAAPGNSRSTAAMAACSSRGSAVTRPVCVSASTQPRKLRSRDADHREHRGRHRPLFLEQPVAHLLGVVRVVAQLRRGRPCGRCPSACGSRGARCAALRGRRDWRRAPRDCCATESSTSAASNR